MVTWKTADYLAPKVLLNGDQEIYCGRALINLQHASQSSNVAEAQLEDS
jgi:hypothetical protein